MRYRPNSTLAHFSKESVTQLTYEDDIFEPVWFTILDNIVHCSKYWMTHESSMAVEWVLYIV